MKKLLFLFTLMTTTAMSQNEIRNAVREVRGTAREVKSTTREVKGATKESKAMVNELRGNSEKDAASPAKSYIKKFWEYVEKMEAAPTDLNILGTNSRAAATAINNIKMKDKGYDVSPLEAELSKWQQSYEIARSGGETQRGATNDVAALFKLLYQVKTNVAQQEIESKLQEIEIYKTKTAEMVALNLDPTDKFNAAIINNALPRIKVDLQTIDKNVKLWEDNMNMIVDERPARAYYAMIQYEHAHWDALRKGPFAEKAQLEADYQKVTEMVGRIGSLENVFARGKARAVELLKNTRMPAAIAKNEAIENVFRDAYKSMSGVTGTVVKVNLLDRDWQAFRNEITGVLEGRRMRAAIVAKMPSGKHMLYNNFLIHQDYLGTGYSTNSQVLLFEDMEILPENIK
jgi:hypothetical protein